MLSSIALYQIRASRPEVSRDKDVFSPPLDFSAGGSSLSRMAIRPFDAVWTADDGWNGNRVRLRNDQLTAELVRRGRRERV